ncbi:cupin domain-containing protein [Candidatus Pantoea persica]|uniref:cupin domain-containing protein n=1 Tax=Candidatus Pantoea persica TaxID=2518128 RepID=UPI00215D8FD3|nr:cupin domain-containing protein [Candidatus Pantoea persica]MBA2814328.1 hypothetical protein [Candidatus Pantoea persica]
MRSNEILIGQGKKAGIMVEGELTLEIDGDSARLATGDSFQFKSHLPHTIFNHTERAERDARVVWIMPILLEQHL